MHPALDDARTFISDGDVDAALDELLPFISSQLTGDRSHVRKFADFRDEAILHAAGLRGLRTKRRQAVMSDDALDREERRLNTALLGLIEDIDRRLKRTSAPVPVATPKMDMDMADGPIPEKVHGRGNLQSLAWLEQGLMAGRAVCRVITSKAIGTGFLVAGGRVITNNHVVTDAASAEGAKVEFNFERDTEGRLRASVLYQIEPEGFYTLPPPLDCSVLKIRSDPALPDLGQWGALTLDSAARIGVGDPVSIIQHPNGGEKQIAVTANEVVGLSGARIAYMTDTLGGSSGAPVFDERWRVVALHRAGGAVINGRGGTRTRANEGVLFQHLLQDQGLRQALGLDET
jgi:V8-like Glu-specific endopeptidase